MIVDFSCIFEMIWYLKSWRWLVWGIMVTSARSENHEMMGFRVLGKWILKNTNPEWRRIILRSFRVTLFLKFTTKMAHQTPPDPKSPFFLDFPDMYIGNQPFFWDLWCGKQWSSHEGGSGVVFVTHDLGMPKIREFYLEQTLVILVKEDVVWLQVLMDDTLEWTDTEIVGIGDFMAFFCELLTFFCQLIVQFD